MSKLPSRFEMLEYGPSRGLETKPEKLVVLFHGYGRNGWFMDKVAKDISQALPTAKIIVPHGPDSLNLPRKFDLSDMTLPQELLDEKGFLNSDMQRQWFSLKGNMFHIWWRLWRVSKQVNKWVDDILYHYRLQPHDVAYVGFSQGGGIALYAGLLKSSKIGAVCVHSSAYWGMLPIRSKPPVYFVYGDGDDVISQSLYESSVCKLGRKLSNFQSDVIPGQGHYISSESRQKMTEFLARHIKTEN